MKTPGKHSLRSSGAVRAAIAALAFTTALAGMSVGIARADGDDRGREDRGRHEQRWHQHRYVEPRYVYERPHEYYYAPPPVSYYQPPRPSPAIEFVFPLHLR